MRRRRDKKIWLVIVGVFAIVFGITLSSQKINDNNADAANLVGFDAGYIISDFQMGNYTSMSEGQIQNFLKSMNSCNDYNTSKTGNNVGHLSESTPYSWHVKDGHYVCMADEDFNGESAAHIIWQAARDFRINPQVLIVLLQKEQGLVTDTFPNSVQYRSATGYGCPDTAACSSTYYGFKNQVRNAAEMFRSVLDGGWTNYPLGNNYVKYNPKAACGGSVVNIRNLATSALYRYTPYQPNATTLAGGSDACSAYGNKNFYVYFEDWFGGIKGDGYIRLETPRNMRLKAETERINPNTGEVVDILPAGMVRRFVTKIWMDSGEWCLRTEYSTNNVMNACIKISDLEEYYEDFQNSRYLRLKWDTERINPYNGEVYDTLESGKVLMYTTKIFMNGKWYYRTQYMSDNNMDVVVPADSVEEVYYEPFKNPRYLLLVKDSNLVNPYNGEKITSLDSGNIIKYTSKILINNKWYYRSEEATNKNIDVVMDSELLIEVPNYENFINPRLLVLNKNIERINPYTGEVYDELEKGRVLEYITKIFINNEWYYRTRYMTNNNMDVVVPASALNEV